MELSVLLACTIIAIFGSRYLWVCVYFSLVNEEEQTYSPRSELWKYLRYILNAYETKIFLHSFVGWAYWILNLCYLRVLYFLYSCLFVLPYGTVVSSFCDLGIWVCRILVLMHDASYFSYFRLRLWRLSTCEHDTSVSVFIVLFRWYIIIVLLITINFFFLKRTIKE